MDPRVPVPAVRSGTDQLRWVHAYDDHTVVFFHKEPLATNVQNVNFPILPRHVYEQTWEQDPTLKDSPVHVKLEQSPVCGGPYEIVDRKRAQEIVLRRRASWSSFRGKKVREEPFFAEVRFRIVEDPNTALLALKAGEIDEMMLTPEQWTTQATKDDFYERCTKATAPEWVSFHFGWNIDTPFFADRRVRRAMSYAFDHDQMLEKLCYGLYKPCVGNFPEGSWMASKKKLAPYKQDLDRAEALLDEAGWIDHDNDGARDKEIDGRLVPFEFSMLVNNQPLRVKIATLLKENLDQVGVRLNVRPLEATVLQQLTQDKKFQAYFGDRCGPELHQLFQARGRPALRGGPPRARPRQAGRKIRADPGDPLRGSALYLALHAKQLLRVLQDPAGIRLQPAGPLQLFPRLRQHLEAAVGVSDGHLPPATLPARHPDAAGDHLLRLCPGPQHAGQPADGADGGGSEPEAQPGGRRADAPQLRPRQAVVRRLRAMAGKPGSRRPGAVDHPQAAGDDADPRADRTHAARLGHGLPADLAPGRAAGALCLGPQRNSRRAGGEPAALRALLVPCRCSA